MIWEYKKNKRIKEKYYRNERLKNPDYNEFKEMIARLKSCGFQFDDTLLKILMKTTFFRYGCDQFTETRKLAEKSKQLPCKWPTLLTLYMAS